MSNDTTRILYCDTLIKKKEKTQNKIEVYLIAVVWFLFLLQDFGSLLFVKHVRNWIANIQQRFLQFKRHAKRNRVQVQIPEPSVQYSCLKESEGIMLRIWCEPDEEQSIDKQLRHWMPHAQQISVVLHPDKRQDTQSVEALQWMGIQIEYNTVRDEKTLSYHDLQKIPL